MVALMERLATRRASAVAKQVETYAALVKAVADDKPPAVERVEAILLDSAKSPADLAADVARVKERRQLAAVAARLPELEAKKAALDGAFVPLRDLIAEAQRKYQEGQFENQQAQNALRPELFAAQAARDQLRAMTPELEPRRQALLTRKHALMGERGRIVETIGDEKQGTGTAGVVAGLRQWLKAYKAGSVRPHQVLQHDGTPYIQAAPLSEEDCQRRHDSTEMGLRAFRVDLQKINDTLAEVETELAEIERQQLQP